MMMRQMLVILLVIDTFFAMVKSKGTGRSSKNKDTGTYKLTEEIRIDVNASDSKTCYDALKNCKGNAKCRDALTNVDVKCKVRLFFFIIV